MERVKIEVNRFIKNILADKELVYKLAPNALYDGETHELIRQETVWGFAKHPIFGNAINQESINIKD